MINQELKLLLESLSDTVNDSGLNISDECIFIQACTFMGTPRAVGQVPQETEGSKNKKGKPASEAQIKYFHKHGLGDTENLTAQEAFKKIKEHKEKNG